MTKIQLPVIILVFALFVLEAAGAPPIVIHDGSGCLRQTEAPVTVVANLKPALLKAAQRQRLAVSLTEAGEPQVLIPAQVETNGLGKAEAVVFMMPAGPVRPSLGFKLVAARDPLAGGVRVVERHDGQYDLLDSRAPVLRYNYRTVEPGEIATLVSEGNRIYTRARSDYIHPLYGLGGEELTLDWSLDHPHHRGIYWAWPEVDYGTERGDLHALQRVFARPTGKVRTQSGPVYAQVEAESEWIWEDREPIVKELATIRAYRTTARGRFIDLVFQFVALKAGVTVARRGTDKYGGLSIRLVQPQGQEISVFTDPVGAKPGRAWSDLSGVFPGQSSASGLLVIQHRDNPDYPGEWVQYPELSWCQPTFPAGGSRYALVPGKPLVLHYRLWIHSGGKLSAENCALAWDAFHAPEAAKP